MSLDQLFELAKVHGAEGIIVALVVLVFVYLAKFGGLIKNGNAARIVNVVLSVVFGGYQFGDDAGAIVATIASLGSALLYKLFEFLASRIQNRLQRG
jgi:hypothetical protein